MFDLRKSPSLSYFIVHSLFSVHKPTRNIQLFVCSWEKYNLPCFFVTLDRDAFQHFFIILTRFYPLPCNSLIVINPWQGNFRYFSNWQKLHLVPCQRWNLHCTDVSTSILLKCKKKFNSWWWNFSTLYVTNRFCFSQPWNMKKFFKTVWKCNIYGILWSFTLPWMFECHSLVLFGFGKQKVIWQNITTKGSCFWKQHSPSISD